MFLDNIITLNDITNLLNIKCDSYSHANCRNIKQKIIDYHKLGNKVTNDFLKLYLMYINDSSNGDYYNRCIDRLDFCLQVVKEILEYLVPTEEDIWILTKIQINLNIAITLYNKRGLYSNFCAKINDNMNSIFKIIINASNSIQIPISILEYTLGLKHLELSNYLLNYVNCNELCLELACLCTESYETINLMLNQKIQVTEKSLINAIRLNDFNIVKLLLKSNYIPNEYCLIEACKIKNKEIIIEILLYKIQPTQECFNALFTSVTFSCLKDKTSCMAPQIATLIDILVNFGYIITYEDVCKALSHGCYVNNINNLGILFDEKFIEECTLYGYYPYENFNIKPTMKCLYVESKRPGNASNLKKLILQGLTPDIECLKYACDNKTNIQNVKYLIENHNIKPNLDCLKILAKNIGNSTLTYLLDNFQEN